MILDISDFEGEKGYEQFNSCPFCGCKNLETLALIYSSPYFRTEICHTFVTVATMLTYAVCKNCGLCLQDPRPKQEHLKEFYESGIYTKTLGLKEEALYDTEWDRAAQVTRFLSFNNIKPISVMDFGASRGLFIDMLKTRFDTTGYGMDLYGKYKDQEPHKAEMVSSLHTLEHCSDPFEELKKYREYTEKWLLLEVPKVAEPPDYKGLRFAHLYSFPKEVIEKMVEQAGFKIVAEEMSPDIRILAEAI